ncbi:MAG: RbsD or FucU transport [Ktedonobacteraceae bacterium]|nr:RbsD or FucU transport [Ktedonobacteraceae bacterium]
MLLTRLTHPEIARALAGAGHGSKVLIGDGNYPLSTGSNKEAVHVYLNLRPGMVPVDDILETILSAIPVEAATVMSPNDDRVPEPPIFNDFRGLLAPIDLSQVGRSEFYRRACQPDVALAILSGDQRLYANILLTIGVVQPS